MEIDINKIHQGTLAEDLFSFAELENLINLKPFVNINRFKPTSFDNPKITKEYKWPIPIWCSDRNIWPVKEVKTFINESACYLSDCSRVNKKINLFCKKLEETFKKPVDCHIYFSLKKNTKSYDLHNDNYATLILAQEGEIKATVGDQIFYLKKGEYVCIPPKIYHKVEHLSEKRLSLSFVLFEGEGNFEERDWINFN
tara:strand:+ start:3276 stop:3869 length:594 start_codon:yes stop_codon:yes gene_type:complete